MRTTPITVTEAVRHFSEYVHRAAYGHERFLLKRGRHALAELQPARPPGITLGVLPDVLDSLPHLGKGEATAFAADLKATAQRTRSERLRDPEPRGVPAGARAEGRDLAVALAPGRRLRCAPSGAGGRSSR